MNSHVIIKENDSRKAQLNIKYQKFLYLFKKYFINIEFHE